MAALKSMFSFGHRLGYSTLDRRLHAGPAVGAPLAPLGAWAVLALASDDAPFLKHVAGLLNDADRSRARARLKQQRLVDLLPRLRGRAVDRRFVVQAAALVELVAARHVVLAGTSAAPALRWTLFSGAWPIEAYVAETHLAVIGSEWTSSSR